MNLKKLKTAIIGASGYSGAQLARILSHHPHSELTGLYVSKNSLDAGKKLHELYPQLRNVVSLELQPILDINQVAENVDAVFLATAHEVSHDIAKCFLDKNVTVFDLSGAFRVPDPAFYQSYYGFEHQYPDLLNSAVYGLAEFAADALKQASLIAVPGCYPTAAQLALKPLIDASLLDLSVWPVINATSGVSGAGRKATLTNSFCEVSLQPYGLFKHRHQPEISYHLGTDVIFTPHLGNFDRGILATITCKLKPGVSRDKIVMAYQNAYQGQEIVRLYEEGIPALKSVVGLPYCDIGFAVEGEHAILVSAEDNLLKGAASQAVQCFNLRYGLASSTGLV
ncbi:N-acetyl-gamma-glutamyl-phosphate reductase [Thorsellia anophelis]|uniref:N-acetyl-gamma-glutamyl-phosphate reductase n=1 Tax=Thorsellia anophelis DSM 18579 TaxID=1123402 RepID=A0A1H9Z8H5_9GAMM|nr:N-acetyl-gamma-glutamyl-phosphate reductase [Thorsellia anophelis]SES77854.1 N-acetyl-gamma-glutamyl-phosphate reductase [Thorsellia anophelis DSM 18579]